MKRIILILVIIALLVFIVSCIEQEEAKELIEQEQMACEKPYIMVSGDCCLDDNNNGICDKNEVEKKPGVDLLPGPSVSERCEAGSKMQCVGYTIGLNEIAVKFQSTSKDFINVKKIALLSLGCSAEFKSNAELRFNEMQEFKIPCTIKHTTIDSNMAITADIRIVNIKGSGEVYDVSAPTESEMKGHISGAVKI